MDKNTYRGKRKDNGEWITGYYFPMLAYNRAYIGYIRFEDGACWPDFVEVIPETVGQCTGLPDKNGKAIFEGDIIVARLKEGAYKGFEWPARPVLFENGSFGLKYNAAYQPLCSFAPNVELEIIGNIHDNPEILEGK